jgi:hypothetical protein
MPDAKKHNLLDLNQHDLIENAQRRIRQKKWLFHHITLFLIGGVFVFVLNKLFHYGPDYDWYLVVLIFWALLLAYHTISVTILNRLLGPKWERREREKLIQLQQDRIAQMQTKVTADQLDEKGS